MKTTSRTLFASVCAAMIFSVATSHAAEEKKLNVFIWSDYLAADTISKFEAETGIKVTLDYYDSNEMLEAKLLSGKTGYDIVVPTSGFLDRQIKAGVYQKLDKASIPNLSHMDSALMERMAQFDPGNAYAVPYMVGTNGLGLNPEKVKAAVGTDAPLDSWALVFDPKNAEKVSKCGFYMMDSPSEVFPIVLNYLGLNPNSADPKDYEKAEQLLLKIRPFISKFHSSESINALANGDICVAIGFSGDMLQARNRAEEAKNGVVLSYAVPKEGTEVWFDSTAIPKDAPHPANANAFINFLQKPEIIADISNTVFYANANKDATALVKEDVRNDPGVYPPEAVKAKLYVKTTPDQKVERLRTRIWNKVKTGK